MGSLRPCLPISWMQAIQHRLSANKLLQTIANIGSDSSGAAKSQPTNVSRECINESLQQHTSATFELPVSLSKLHRQEHAATSASRFISGHRQDVSRTISPHVPALTPPPQGQPFRTETPIICKVLKTCVFAPAHPFVHSVMFTLAYIISCGPCNLL